VTDRTDVGRPIRVAIVGGGCAGAAAAWHLSQQPGYEVHVYEKSWRLGGKGASVRDGGGRIRDHGLHVWLGFYENAFRMARECYAEVQRRRWGPDGGAHSRLTHGSFEQAFFPEPHIGVAGRDASGDWVVWSGLLPAAPGIPGDPLVPGSNPFTLTNYLLRCIDLLKTLMLSVIGPPQDDDPNNPKAAYKSAFDEVIERYVPGDEAGSADHIIERIATGVRSATLTAAAALLQTAAIVERVLQGHVLSMRSLDSALDLLRALAAQVRKELEGVVAIDPKLRRKTEIIDIVMTVVVGLYRDRVLFERQGLDTINDVDYRAWLQRHGATRSSRDSRFLAGIYDFLFAYEKGKRDNPQLAAGVALRGALRMFFSYRGAMFWRMRSGMGDAVFAPLYKVMLLDDRVAKGGASVRLPAVKFHFLHELSGITLDNPGPGRRFVTELHFRTGGDPDVLDRRGNDALDDLGCWPDRPRFGSVVGPGSTDRRTLKVSDDFDAVVLAMCIEDLKNLGHGAPPNQPGSFLDAMPADWREMAGKVQTVATEAAQVWLSKDLEGLGWYRGSLLVSALGRRFDTWADMTHTLGSERAWREGSKAETPDADKALSVAYFCGVLADEVAKKDPAHAKRKVENDLENMLVDGMKHFWPSAFEQGHTAKELVVGEPHTQVNTQGSDRYVLSLPKSIDKRISPLDCPVLNMTIAGDWTACGLDVGCIEAAVMSGMLAAHAITGDAPSLESIIGYDHP
jgi:uncharacterized protein with NAD-binding domain and iron-sulfur cluster